MAGLLVRDCDVLQFNNGQPEFLIHHNIRVEENRIEAIYPTGEWQSNPDIKVIDAGGMLAVPGMINTHAHVPMVLFRGVAEDVPLEEWFNDYIFPMESNLTPEDVYWGAMLGIAEMIEAGITCVADHYFFMDSVAEAIQKSGIRGDLAWAVFEHEGLEKLDETTAFITRWQGQANDRIRTWLGPHSPYLCGPEFLKTCAQKAVELDVGIHLHVSETKEQVALSRQKYGMTPIRLLEETGILERPTILAHCLFPEEEDLVLLRNHPAGIGHAPKTYMRAGLELGSLQPYLDNRIPIGLASDGAASNSTLDLYEQMRLMGLTQKIVEGDARSMPLDDILRIAFLGGANVCRHSELANLKPGNLADIVLIRQDRASQIPRLNIAANLVYASSATDVDTVICDGQILLQGRQHLTLNKDQIKQEVEGRLEKLVTRVPGRKVAVYPT